MRGDKKRKVDEEDDNVNDRNSVNIKNRLRRRPQSLKEEKKGIATEAASRPVRRRSSRKEVPSTTNEQALEANAQVSSDVPENENSEQSNSADIEPVLTLTVDKEVKVGSFWRDSKILVPGGGYIPAKEPLLSREEAAQDLREFLAACNRLRSFANSTRLSILLGRRRSPEWCGMVLRLLHRTGVNFFSDCSLTATEDQQPFPNGNLGETLKPARGETRKRMIPSTASGFSSDHSTVHSPNMQSKRARINGPACASSTVSDALPRNFVANQPQFQASRLSEGMRIPNGIANDPMKSAHYPPKSLDESSEERLFDLASLSDTDTSDDGDEHCTHLVESRLEVSHSSHRQYIENASFQKAHTLKRFVATCKKFGQSFLEVKDWKKPEVQSSGSFNWSQKPQLILTPTRRVLSQPGVAFQWQNIYPIQKEKFLARCALIQVNSLVNSLLNESIECSRYPWHDTSSLVFAIAPAPVHYLSTVAASFAVRVTSIAARFSKRFQRTTGDICRVITGSDVERALQWLSTSESHSSAAFLLQGSTPWRLDGSLRPTSSLNQGLQLPQTEVGKVQLCSRKPESFVSFPLDLQHEMESIRSFLVFRNKSKKGQEARYSHSFENVSCSSHGDSDFSGWSDATGDTLKSPISPLKVAKNGVNGWVVHGRWDNSASESSGSSSSSASRSDGLDPSSSHSSFSSNTKLDASIEFGVYDDDTVHFLRGTSQCNSLQSGGSVCWHRLAWLVLYFLGHYPYENPQSSYGALCNYSSFAGVGVGGSISANKDALCKLAAAADCVVQKEASILASCATHDDGRPWIDHADVALLCAVRKVPMPEL